MGARNTTESGAFERRFVAALDRLAHDNVPGRWLVAFSGGLDSTLLLHALKRARPVARIVACHVDHGLHADAPRWSAHSARVAAALGVEYIARKVRIEAGPAASLEAAAREARYAALAPMVEPGDFLLTAHHADDQLETVLLRLLRGTGVRGLSAIRGTMPFGAGLLVRPLLGFSRVEIRAEAIALGLEWLEDPSNQDTRFDRNYLRARCLPPLLERWPHAGAVADRLARQMAEADSVLGEVAEQDLAGAEDPARLPVSLLVGLSTPRLNNALRHALLRLGLPVPSAAQLAELRRALGSREDALAIVSWPGVEARRFRDHLYLLAPFEARASEPGRVQADRVLPLAEGELRLVAAADYGIPDRWAREGIDVAFRVGGERFRPYRSQHHKPLKQWFQEAGIVPWMRAAVPLLYHDDRLIAVADLCLAAELPHSADDAPFWRPVWSGHAPLH